MSESSREFVCSLQCIESKQNILLYALKFYIKVMVDFNDCSVSKAISSNPTRVLNEDYILQRYFYATASSCTLP